MLEVIHLKEDFRPRHIFLSIKTIHAQIFVHPRLHFHHISNLLLKRDFLLLKV
jgi:hypothetical protein